MARATSQVPPKCPPSATLSQSITPQVSPLKYHHGVVLRRHSRYATAMPPGAMSRRQNPSDNFCGQPNMRSPASM